VQLFYFLNGLAGRSELFDTALRFFYVSAVPFLATALAAILIFWPREPHTPSRLRVAFAAFLSLAACLALQRGVDSFGQWALGSEMLSPRPFVTHWVNWLVVEPNDNSLPCIEAMLAGTLATAIWAARPHAAAWAWPLAFSFGLTRVIAGNNYPADAFLGLALGGGIAACVLALCGAPLAWLGKRSFIWRTGRQLGLGLGVFLLALAYTGLIVRAQPGNAQKLSDAFWNRRPAVRADSSPEGEGMTAGVSYAARNRGLNLQRDMPKPGVTTLGGHFPAAEKNLLISFRNLDLAHRLVSIDAAELRDRDARGDWSYRAAAVRFEVQKEGAAERREVMKSASRIARSAFHADAQLRNIDITGVTLNEPGKTTKRSVFAIGAVPVFSASIERSTLLNGDPDAPAEAWLSARSKLYINTRVLPETDPQPSVPLILPTPTPVPTPTKPPIPTPTQAASPTPTRTPTVVAPPVVPKPTLVPKPTPRQTPRATPRPAPKPAPRPAPRATPKPAPRVQPRRTRPIRRTPRIRRRVSQRDRRRFIQPRRVQPRRVVPQRMAPRRTIQPRRTVPPRRPRTAPIRRTPIRRAPRRVTSSARPEITRPATPRIAPPVARPTRPPITSQ
jgi:hypothetical protein